MCNSEALYAATKPFETFLEMLEMISWRLQKKSQRIKHVFLVLYIFEKVFSSFIQKRNEAFSIHFDKKFVFISFFLSFQ